MLSIILCFTMVMVPFCSCYANSKMSEWSEELICDGTKYIIEHCHNEEWYIIDVTDTNLNEVSQVKRNLITNDIYLNGDLIGYSIPCVGGKQTDVLRGVNDIWITLSSGSTEVSFAQAATYVIVATILASILNPMVGIAGVISAMGTATLAALAGLTVGCTVSMTLQYANASLTQQIYRNIWYVSHDDTTEGPFLYSWIVQAEV